MPSVSLTALARTALRGVVAIGFASAISMTGLGPSLSTAVAQSTEARPHRGDRACVGVLCGGRGTCFEENGAAHCLCDAGFSELALECVPAANGAEANAMRARRGADVQGAILEVLEPEIGRGRAQVGADLGRFPGRLADYLEPYEWWCGDFVSWVYAAAGIPFTGGSSGGWHITDNRAIAAWYAQRGLWFDRAHPDWRETAPQVGDFVRIRTARYGHAAVVMEVRGDTVYTAEGNVETSVERGVYYHFHRNRLIDGFGRTFLGNDLPEVDAGADVVLVLGEPLVLRGEVTDTGPPEELNVRWSGPPAAMFVTPNDPHTAVRFTDGGEYTLVLTATDGEGDPISDEVQVLVVEPPPPPPPDPGPQPEPRAAPASESDSWGCAIGPSSAPSTLGLVALLAIWAYGRRRHD